CVTASRQVRALTRRVAERCSRSSSPVFRLQQCGYPILSRFWQSVVRTSVIPWLNPRNNLALAFVTSGRGNAMETLRQDIAYALRQMRQSPVFALTALITL